MYTYKRYSRKIDIQKLKHLYCDLRLPCIVVANNLGCALSTVYTNVSKYKLSKKPKPRKIVLTDDDVREIKRLRSEGMSYIAISKIYSKVTHSHIINICKGKVWKGVKNEGDL